MKFGSEEVYDKKNSAFLVKQERNEMSVLCKMINLVLGRTIFKDSIKVISCNILFFKKIILDREFYHEQDHEFLREESSGK